MSEFDDLYSELTSYINILELRFLNRFLAADVDPFLPPSEYELDVRAYCILSHAALEDFFEQTAQKIMTKSLDEWANSNFKINDSLLTLASYASYKFEKIEEDTLSPVEYLRRVFDDANRKLSQSIFNNHGTSQRYLKDILLPVALQVNQDPALQNSLQQLVKQRGDYAHRGVVKNILAPESARRYVQDCLKLCLDIRDKANSKFS